VYQNLDAVLVSSAVDSRMAVVLVSNPRLCVIVEGRLCNSFIKFM